MTAHKKRSSKKTSKYHKKIKLNISDEERERVKGIFDNALQKKGK